MKELDSEWTLMERARWRCRGGGGIGGEGYEPTQGKEVGQEPGGNEEERRGVGIQLQMS